MILGIVGSEEAKFNEETKKRVPTIMVGLFEEYKPECVVSGMCHLGGIDTWAVECAKAANILTREFPPKTHTWTNGYKLRNIEIAKFSDVVVCITVREYHDGYKGMKFTDVTGEPFCYHCGTREPRHVKSGGCWTVKYARRLGKEGRIIIV